METPFVFGKIASGEEFADREKELQHLAANFQSGINTILISPRRWGKSSLVHKAALFTEKKNKKILFCHVDLFNVRNEEQFYQALAQENHPRILNEMGGTHRVHEAVYGARHSQNNLQP